MALPITITDDGRAEIINAQNTGTGPVTITEIGFGTGQYTPTKTRTALQAQVKRVSSIAGQAVAADTIHVMALDESSAAYNVGEFGLFSDKGTLIAVYSQPAASGWIIQKAGPSTLLLATDIILESLNATSITFGDVSFINPPATTTVQGVVELATPEETQTGTDGSRAVTPAGLKSLTGSTSRAGLIQLNNTLISTSTAQALTAAQGKKLQDEKQPADPTLTALAALVTAENKLIYATGADAFATADLTVFARTLLAALNASAARTTLGLGMAATRNVTVSPTDTTPEQLLRFADFGIGDAIPMVGGTDLNTVTQPGTYAYLTGAELINAPMVGAGYLTVHGKKPYPHQEFRRIYMNRVFVRSASVASPTAAAADWNPWVEIFHSGNISGFAKTLLDDETADTARVTLGAQASDQTLTALAALATAADKLIYATGVDAFATTDFTPFARTLLDDLDAASARSTLGLGTAAEGTLTKTREDANIGRVVRVGDAGILAPIELEGGRTIADTASAPGASYTRGTAPLPADNPSNSAIRWMNWGASSWSMQLASAAYSERIWIRTRSSSGAPFRPWQELYHTGNHPEASQTEAEAGAITGKWMSPLRVFQAISKKVVQATETVVGLARIATQSEVNAGASDTTSVTPKKLRFGFSISLTQNGYVVLPQWLGGLIVQWGKTGAASPNNGVNVTYPLAFPTALFSLVATTTGAATDSVPDYAVHTRLVTTTGFRLANPDNYETIPGAFWIAVGH